MFGGGSGTCWGVSNCVLRKAIPTHWDLNRKCAEFSEAEKTVAVALKNAGVVSIGREEGAEGMVQLFGPDFVCVGSVPSDVFPSVWIGEDVMLQDVVEEG